MQYFCLQLLDTGKYESFHLIRPWMQHRDRKKEQAFHSVGYLRATQCFHFCVLHCPADRFPTHQFSDPVPTFTPFLWTSCSRETIAHRCPHLYFTAMSLWSCALLKCCSLLNSHSSQPADIRGQLSAGLGVFCHFICWDFKPSWHKIYSNTSLKRWVHGA